MGTKQKRRKTFDPGFDFLRRQLVGGVFLSCLPCYLADFVWCTLYCKDVHWAVYRVPTGPFISAPPLSSPQEEQNMRRLGGTATDAQGTN